MSATAPKRQKMEPRRQQQKKFMQVGQRGFLVTCNFREKECIRESYNLLNSYLQDRQDQENVTEPDPPPTQSSDGEEDDISTQLANEIKASKVEAKERIFQAVNTETTNCVFIDAKVEDPLELGVRIVRDIAESKMAKTRFLLRLIPVEIVCRANLVDMMAAVESLFDKHFLAEPKTFAIIFNRRYNNSIKRDDVIREFADIIQAKNAKNKVDLSTPQLSVIVEIIKGFCCLSVLPDYYALKKYNVVELCAANPVDKTTNNVPEDTPKTE